MAKIQLNGGTHEIRTGMNLKQLLDKLKIVHNKVAIEINGTIAAKNNYDNIILNNNDKLEIVHFIGGG